VGPKIERIDDYWWCYTQVAFDKSFEDEP